MEWGRIMTVPVVAVPLKRRGPSVPFWESEDADAIDIVHTAINDARVNITPLFDDLRTMDLPASVANALSFLVSNLPVTPPRDEGPFLFHGFIRGCLGEGQ